MDMRAKLNSLSVPRITRFVAVVAIAVSAGHLAQSMSDRKPVPALAAATPALPTRIVQLSAGGEVAVVPRPPHVMAVERPTALVPDAVACEVSLTLKPQPLAMIDIALSAPCHKSERVVLQQADLAITVKLGTDGAVALMLPAMTADGHVSAVFGDGTRVEEAAMVPDLADLKRFGVQWQGADAFALHAMENGADFDQPGDISHNNMGDPTLVAGGVLTVLGDASVQNPLLAEVYTYPRTVALQAVGAEPLIVLEAAILPETCGHDLLGDVLISRSGRLERTDLTLAMPDCSAVGDFLVLKNLASDMKIAAN